MKRFCFFGVFFVCLFVGAAFGDGSYDAGTGKADDPYEIATAGQLNELSLHKEDWGKCFILTDDIDMDPAVTGIAAYSKSLIGTYVSISNTANNFPFTGTFDGGDCIGATHIGQ